jgi:hypothetical protein
MRHIDKAGGACMMPSMLKMKRLLRGVVGVALVGALVGLGVGCACKSAPATTTPAGSGGDGDVCGEPAPGEHAHGEGQPGHGEHGGHGAHGGHGEHGGHGGHGEHGEHGGGEHAKEHANLPPTMTAFHDILAPLWHADEGAQRTTDTCNAIGELTTRARAIRTDAAPAGTDATVWTNAGVALEASVKNLHSECMTAARGAFQPTFADVHDKFHALLALSPH